MKPADKKQELVFNTSIAPPRRAMKILHVAPLSGKSPNGISVSVPNLVLAQSRIPDVQVGLFVSLKNPGRLPSFPFPVVCWQNVGLQASPAAIWRSIVTRLFVPDLIVFHSTFVPLHGELARQARLRGIPYVICPRGGMTEEAIQYKPWKKWLGRKLFFDRLVSGASAIHYLTQGELERSGDWGRPIIIAGNGVWPPDATDLATPGRAKLRTFLFLGRLHIEHKGLDLLLEAVDRCQRHLRRNQTRIRLVGPDCQGSRAWLAGQIQQRGLGDIVSLHGPVLGEEKTRTFASADVFLHPSRTEGHPLAVLEALAHGLPVLITPQTNVLHDVLDAHAGWGVSCDPADLARALVRLSELSPAALAAAGRAARQLAVEHFSWDHIARKTLAKYSRLVRVAQVA